MATIVVLVCSAVLVLGCSGRESIRGSQPPATIALYEHESGSPIGAFLRVSDQYSDGKGMEIDEVVMGETGGYVVVHSDGLGESGGVVGVSDWLRPGVNLDVEVALNPPLKSSGRVFPMVHGDSNRNGLYEFPEGDGPLRVDGKPVSVLVQMYFR